VSAFDKYLPSTYQAIKALASTLTPLTGGPLQVVRWVTRPSREPSGALKG